MPERTLLACRLATLLITALGAGSLLAQSYSPHADEQFPRRVLWGDTHVHSNLSLDLEANLQCGTGILIAQHLGFFGHAA